MISFRIAFVAALLAAAIVGAFGRDFLGRPHWGQPEMAAPADDPRECDYLRDFIAGAAAGDPSEFVSPGERLDFQSFIRAELDKLPCRVVREAAATY